MFKKSIAIAVVILAIFTVSLALAEDDTDAAAAQQAAPAARKHLFTFQDNAFKYSFSPSWRVPFQGVPSNNNVHTGKPYNVGGHLMEFTHVDIGNKFGDNTLNVAFLAYSHFDPASPAFYNYDTSAGGHSIYVTYRHNFVLGRLLNKDLSWGPIKDVLVTVGTDMGTNNDAWGNRRMSPMVGPGLAFKVPNGGYATLSAMWTREWNHEGTDVTSWTYCNTGDRTTYTSCASAPNFMSGLTHPFPNTWGKRVVYDHEATLQAAWGIPFRIGGVMLNYEGYGVLNSTKGHTAGSLEPDFSGGVAPPEYEYQYTKPELLIHSVLKYNIGRHFGENHHIDVGVGYEYWNNEYGLDHHKVLGTLQNAPFLQLQIHL